MRRKLIVLISASVGGAIAVSVTTAIWQQTENFTALRRETLVATAEVFAAALGPAVAARHEREAFLALRAMGRVPDIEYAEVRTIEGRVLATFGAAARLVRDLSIENATSVAPWQMLRSGTIEVRVPVLDGGSPVGHVVLIGNISGLWPKLLSTLFYTVGGGLLALLLAIAIAWRRQRIVTEPLRALLKAMLGIRERQSTGLPLDNAADREIGELISGFNTMLADLREQDAKLLSYHRELEQKVLDRTAQLAEARDVADSANRAKSDFLATMSHEIRTPMNGIMVMAELLSVGELPAKQRRFAEVIARSGQNLLAIINDILDFSKIEAGKMEIERIAVDINELAESITTLFGERARAKGIDLCAIVDPYVPKLLRGDPVRLSQVMTNLVNNALKFTDSGSVTLAIRKAAGTSDRLEMAVTDTGIGIAAEKIGTIFEAFSQADQSTTRQFGGTGLGLTICKRLVAAMGGEIRAESTPGVGSTFSVTIPCERIEQNAWRVPLPNGGLALCLLDVEGAATAAALHRYLTASGYTVVPAQADRTSPPLHGVSLVCIDAARANTIVRDQDQDRPTVIALCEFGDLSSERLLAEGAADALLSKPILRSETEALLMRVANRDLAAASAAPAQHPSRPALRRFKALVADDSPVNLEVATAAVAQLGGVVETATNGREAFELWSRSAFDIVLMDGSMPEMDGFEATRRIRAAEHMQGRGPVPIIALTAHVVGIASTEWRSAGMDDILHKPFTLRQLSIIVSRFVAAQAEPAADPKPKAEPASASEGRPTWGVGSPRLDPLVLDEMWALGAQSKDDFVGRVCRLYIEHAPASLDEIQRAALAGDVESCAKAAHALKSMSLNIGATEVARIAAAIEAAGRTEHQTPAEDLLAQLRSELQETLTEIKALADTRGPGAQPDMAAGRAVSAV